MTIFPVQAQPWRRGSATASSAVYLAAYEVYAHVHGPQKAMLEGTCRGGFSVGELVAFLYARPFPRSEWHDRVEEAFKGLNV